MHGEPALELVGSILGEVSASFAPTVLINRADNVERVPGRGLVVLSCLGMVDDVWRVAVLMLIGIVLLVGMVVRGHHMRHMTGVWLWVHLWPRKRGWMMAVTGYRVSIDTGC